MKYRCEVFRVEDMELLSAWEGENKAVVKFRALQTKWDYEKCGAKTPHLFLYQVDDNGVETLLPEI